MHLEGHRARTGLAFACASGIFAEVAQVLAADALGGSMFFELLGAAIVDEDFEVHLGLSTELVDVAEELALVGANGLAEDFIIVEDGPKSEGKDGGVLKAVRDDPGMVDAGLLIQSFKGIMLADDDGEVACGVEKNLISAYTKD
jgi:hypothetical protein